MREQSDFIQEPNIECENGVIAFKSSRGSRDSKWRGLN